MEESGHYYTVYYTSLAVGFRQRTAYRHAVLAQMPDEVSRLDATSVAINNCTYRPTHNLSGKWSQVSDQERYRVQSGGHALVNKYASTQTKSSAFTRRHTGNMLMAENPESLKFGLLLHRLGDSYAHSIIGNESQMYSISPRGECLSLDDHGHLRDMHEPDFPFKRKQLFYTYLEHLYNVLSRKVAEYPQFKREGFTPKTYNEIRLRFQDMFAKAERKGPIITRQNQNINMATRGAANRNTDVDENIASALMEEIRQDAHLTLHIDMATYRPENESGYTLPEFLKKHTELNDLHINEQNVTSALDSMMPQLSQEEWLRSLSPEQFKLWQQEQAVKMGINPNNISIGNVFGSFPR